jgi:hypothetical protein
VNGPKVACDQKEDPSATKWQTTSRWSCEQWCAVRIAFLFPDDETRNSKPLGPDSQLPFEDEDDDEDEDDYETVNREPFTI